jgi:hypothetical protein
MNVAKELQAVAKDLTAGYGGVWKSDNADRVIPDLKRALTKWVDQNKGAIEDIANGAGEAVLSIFNDEGDGTFDLTVQDKIRTHMPH